MSEHDDDRWANGQIKDEFKKNAKDHLSPKFNKQDEQQQNQDKIERLKKEYLIRQEDLNVPNELTLSRPKPTKELSHLQKAKDKEIRLENERRIKERMKEIEQELKERQKQLEKTKDRLRER